MLFSRAITALSMVLVLFVMATSSAFAQEAYQAPSAPSAPKTYVVPADQLTPGQIAQLEVGEKLEVVQAVGKYAGVGREIGEGVSGALGALNDEAQKFGDTQVGHFTMAMIAWKIMGDDVMVVAQDLVGSFVGVPFLFFGYIAVLWSYRKRCIPHTVCTEKGAGFFGERKYTLVEPGTGSGWDPAGWAIAHAVMAASITVVGSCMIFS